MAQTINILLTSFPGLGFPSTLSIPLADTATVHDLTNQLLDRLPDSLANQHLMLTTNSNKTLLDTSAHLSTFADSSNLVSLRLSAPLVGGKDFPPNPDGTESHPVQDDQHDQQAQAAEDFQNNQVPEPPSGGLTGSSGGDAGGDDGGADAGGGDDGGE